MKLQCAIRWMQPCKRKKEKVHTFFALSHIHSHRFTLQWQPPAHCRRHCCSDLFWSKQTSLHDTTQYTHSPLHLVSVFFILPLFSAGILFYFMQSQLMYRTYLFFLWFNHLCTLEDVISQAGFPYFYFYLCLAIIAIHYNIALYIKAYFLQLLLVKNRILVLAVLMCQQIYVLTHITKIHRCTHTHTQSRFTWDSCLSQSTHPSVHKPTKENL